MNHGDADILRVTLCPWCLLPQCTHGFCINVGECIKADATMCSCYTIYSPRRRPRNQDLIGDARCDGKRKNRKSAA